MSKGPRRCYASVMVAPPENAPPAGGYGSGPPSGNFGPEPGTAPPARRGTITTLVTWGLVVCLLGTTGVLATFFIRKYLVGAKSSEVKNTLGQLAKDSMMAYEGEGLPGGTAHRICPSASLPVPADAAAISGRKYQSTPLDWQRDQPRSAGFACLHFEMSQPQYYQYRYEATPSSFLVGGRGDLNGDGRFSDFTITGKVIDSRLVTTPSISETDPEE